MKNEMRDFAALLMFEHIISPHHSDLCDVCRRAHALGIKPTPAFLDEGLMCDIQRKENISGDGYFGAFSKRQRAGGK